MALASPLLERLAVLPSAAAPMMEEERLAMETRLGVRREFDVLGDLRKAGETKQSVMNRVTEDDLNPLYPQ
jgi:hypothetical protein